MQHFCRVDCVRLVDLKCWCARMYKTEMYLFFISNSIAINSNGFNHENIQGKSLNKLIHNINLQLRHLQNQQQQYLNYNSTTNAPAQRDELQQKASTNCIGYDSMYSTNNNSWNNIIRCPKVCKI